MIELCCEYLSMVHLTVCSYHVTYAFQSEFSKQARYLKFNEFTLKRVDSLKCVDSL